VRELVCEILMSQERSVRSLTGMLSSGSWRHRDCSTDFGPQRLGSGFPLTLSAGESPPLRLPYG
jgi:hypothetical protein